MCELTPNQILFGERNYEAALNLIISYAQNELVIFDADFSRGGYNSLKRYELLNQFLAKSNKNKLNIVLLDADYLMQNCPRLLGLLKNYSHLMTIYKTNQAAKIAQDCFIIADQQHVLRRFNKDQARFKFNVDDKILATQINERFSELLAETTEKIASYPLGL